MFVNYDVEQEESHRSTKSCVDFVLFLCDVSPPLSCRRKRQPIIRGTSFTDERETSKLNRFQVNFVIMRSYNSL